MHLPQRTCGSGYTQCNNSARSDATPNFWVIIDIRRRPQDDPGPCADARAVTSVQNPSKSPEN
jgi:hypothetical protein